MWRFHALAIIVGVVLAPWTSGIAQDLQPSWYPLQPGDTWIYRKEARNGNMAHPDTERWTTEETVVRTTPIPDLVGILVTKRTKVLDHNVPPGLLLPNDSTKHELAESHLLIRQACVYILDGIDAQGSVCDLNLVSSPCLRPLDSNAQLRPEYRDDLLRGMIPADFCFPMAAGMTWGEVSSTSPAAEYVWRVTGLNADPFGLPGAQTFHLWSHLSSGTKIDRWFQEGIGVVQEVIEHHGTYEESRRQLWKSIIRGHTQSYPLIPARTIPLSDSDCDSPGWRHFSRADGVSFQSSAECVAYSSMRK